MSHSSDLESWRKQASALTGGVSSNYIYNSVVEILRRENVSGSCLDYGAGAGALLKMLSELNLFSHLEGVDLMQRPESLPAGIAWTARDLNDALPANLQNFDVVVSSEVIEHLENPRAAFREFWKILKPGGLLVVTTPNQQSLRSLVSLVSKGHFDQFRDRDYPRHITALLHLDIERCAAEAGFAKGAFSYTNHGLMPLPKSDITWQGVFGKLPSGKWFSDNILYACRKPA